MTEIGKALAANPYPGRVLVLARTADGELAGIYALTGRSESSKRRRGSPRREGQVRRRPPKWWPAGDRDRHRGHVRDLQTCDAVLLTTYESDGSDVRIAPGVHDLHTGARDPDELFDEVWDSFDPAFLVGAAWMQPMRGLAAILRHV
jgi:hypothetical protein